MTFLLRAPDHYDPHRFHYLENLGGPWPWPNTHFRLIERTTERKADAKPFDTEEDARACLKSCNAGKQWEIVPG